MKTNQLTRGQEKRVMYLENKDGLIDGSDARIGWVTFSKSGKTIYYRGREFARAGGSGVRGNYYDVESGDEYWISGVKKSGSNAHPLDSVVVEIDDNAKEAVHELRLHKS